MPKMFVAGAAFLVVFGVTWSLKVSDGPRQTPSILNVSSDVRPGDIISIQGAHFDMTSRVWLRGANGGVATQLAVVNQLGDEWLAAQIPQEWAGAMIMWVSNSAGASSSIKLNGAVPLNLDALQLVPGGAFKVLGQNLLMACFLLPSP